MGKRLLLAVICIAYSTLSHVCMLPMADAQSERGPEFTQSRGTEEPMTAVEPMSGEYCEQCETNYPTESIEQGTPCDSGHCLSQAAPLSSEELPGRCLAGPAVLPSTAMILPPILPVTDEPPIAQPPGRGSPTHLLVLRC